MVIHNSHVCTTAILAQARSLSLERSSNSLQRRASAWPTDDEHAEKIDCVPAQSGGRKPDHGTVQDQEVEHHRRPNYGSRGDEGAASMTMAREELRVELDYDTVMMQRAGTEPAMAMHHCHRRDNHSLR